MDIDVLARPLGTSIGDWLLKGLADSKWTEFRGAAAFLKRSGSKHLVPALHTFTRRHGTSAALAVGVDAGGTSLEGVQDCWQVLTGGFGQLFIVHEGTAGQGIFHPKVYAFGNSTHVSFVAGSGNLTEGGLFVNHEASLAITLSRSHPPSVLEDQLEATLDAWLTPSPWCVEVTPTVLQQLHDSGDLPSETLQRVVARAAAGAIRASASRKPAASLFGASPSTPRPTPTAPPTGLPPAPVTPTKATPAVAVVTSPPAPPSGGVPGTPGVQEFYIEVRPHHNGELFLSYRAINDDPAFFGYPFPGWTTPKRPKNPPYPQLDPDPVVDITIYDHAGGVLKHKTSHPLNVVDYTTKREIRITIPDGLHNYIPEMSVLVMTKDPAPALDYRLEFYPPGTAPTSVTTKLTNKLPTGGRPVARRYGWST